MIKLTAKISPEDLEKFNKETSSEISSEVNLSFAFNSLTGQYYLAFVNDLIVIYNDVVTLEHGLVTANSLTYLENPSADLTVESDLDNYFEEGVYIGKV